MKKHLMHCIIIGILLIILPSCSLFESKSHISKDEFLVYEEIFSSLSDSAYYAIYLEQNTRSIVNYVTETTFSKDLFGKEPKEYLVDFFQEKECDISEGLIGSFIYMNEEKYSLNSMFNPKAQMYFIPGRAIDYYRYNKVNQANPLFLAMHSKRHFEVISLSRAGFAGYNTLALVQVQRHYINRSEDYFLFLKKGKDGWRIESKCYVHGPMPIKRKR